MSLPLVAVLDESGKSNMPNASADSDFAFGGLIFDQNQLEELCEISRSIGKAVQKRDFKYKHVQRNSSARKLFLSATSKLSDPCGAFAMYSAGGSLLKERERMRSEFESIGGDATLLNDKIESMRSNNGAVHLANFLGFFAPCFVKVAERALRPIRVCWDRRSDLPRIQAYCDEQGYLHAKQKMNHGAKVTFGEVADGELSHIVRLAGVLAGDVRYFFRKFGNQVWSHLRQEGHGEQEYLSYATAIDINSVYSLTRIATLNQDLADVEYYSGSRETCLIQGYCEHFVGHAFSFAAPTGILGHIVVENGSRWHIHQIPD